MALATTCPKCQTSFRVAPDQLALRRGMVRCGVCQNVFSGMANLRHVDEILRQRSSAQAAAQQVLHPAPRESAGTIPAGPPAAQTPVDTVAASPAVEPGTHRDGAAETRQQAPEPSQDFAQTDLRTAFFLPETVFGPVTQVRGEVAPYKAAPTAAPGSNLPDRMTPIEDPPPQPAIALRRPGPDTRIRWAQESEQAKREVSAEGSGVVVETPGAVDLGLPGTKPSTIEELAAGTVTDSHVPDQEAPQASVTHTEVSKTNVNNSAVIDDTPLSGVNRPASDAALNIREEGVASGQKRRRKRPVDRSDEAIAYFEPDASHIGFSSRAVAMGWLVCLFAAVMLLFQLMLGSRNVLAANVPILRTPLQSVAGWVGLEIEPPRDLQAVTIESFELHAIDNSGQLALSALLRNRAGHMVQWPALEVALTDGQGTLLVRKVLLPRDYFQGLPAGTSQQAELGMNPRAELPLKLTLEARELTASGYSVTLFYP